jgi:sugar transferase (PEP-CTERM system associated)
VLLLVVYLTINSSLLQGRLPLAELLTGPARTLPAACLFVLTALCVLQSFALYERHRSPIVTTLGRLSVVYALAGITFAGLLMLLPIEEISRLALLKTIAASFGVSFTLRLALPGLSAYLLPTLRVLVIGHDQLAEEVADVLRANDAMEGIEYGGAFNPRTGRYHAPDGSETTRALADIIENEGIGEVVLASLDQRGLPLADLLQFRMGGLLVTDYITFLEREKRYLATDAMRPSWLLFSKGFAHGPARTVAKRLFDIVVSAVLLALLSPLLVIAMAAIWLETGRPIFFRQQRVGLGGKPITILKLRSMVVDAEADGPQWARKNDSRVTRVGKILRLTRLDEVPQLIAVLLGDMSFVGPRPEREYFVEQLRAQIPYYDLRHTIKPGLSGWAQVCYPYGASVDDARAKLRYDLYYIKNHSLLLDVLILLNTIQIVVFGKGAR